jgi:thiol:disulfide interchange protein DsbD
MAQTDTSAPAPERSGLIWSLLLVFLAGIGASLTPCVYPMIPITMAIVGAKGGGKARGFALSAVLVLGMAVTYTTLGVLAAKSGAAFGAFAQKPAFLIPVSLLFAAFALSLFGAFEITLPSSLAARLQGDGSRKGFGGAFLMGLVLGPLSAPCVGPVIGAVLVGIAQQGNVWLGGLQLFVFSLGMGLLFLAVGTFSAGLPRSGEWLTRFKHIMGLVVLGFAAWNVRLVVPAWANFGMWTLVMLAGAAVFGVFESAVDLLGQLRKCLAILLLVFGVLLGVRAVETFLAVDLLPRGAAAAGAKEEHAGWLEQDLEGALAKAKAEHKVVLVDIYAEWCAQCKELDEKTWPDPAVKQWLAQNAVAIRIDTDARRKDLAAKLQIRSYPTVLLLDAEGRELRRLLGFEKPETMKAWLEGK